MRSRRQFLAATAAGVLAQSGLVRAASFDNTRWPAGMATPPLQALDLHGKTWRLSDLRGRAVLLNFWATWCPPCRAEMPSLQQLADIYGQDKLVVLAINVGEGPRRIMQYMQASGMNLPVLLDPKTEIARQWGADALPTSILIDTQGRPRQRLRGEVDWSGREAAALVDALLRA